MLRLISPGRRFTRAKVFNSDISSWDTSSVTRLDFMFGIAGNFNQDISVWDTSSVTDMRNALFGALAFDADITGWDVSSLVIAGFMCAGRVPSAVCGLTSSTRFSADSAWNLSYVNVVVPGSMDGPPSDWRPIRCNSDSCIEPQCTSSARCIGPA